MKQSRAMSLIEAVANVVVGYVLAIATQIVVFPWFGIETGLAKPPTSPPVSSPLQNSNRSHRAAALKTGKNRGAH